MSKPTIEITRTNPKEEPNVIEVANRTLQKKTTTYHRKRERDSNETKLNPSSSIGESKFSTT